MVRELSVNHRCPAASGKEEQVDWCASSLLHKVAGAAPLVPEGLVTFDDADVWIRSNFTVISIAICCVLIS